jgi:hypothetical protein
MMRRTCFSLVIFAALCRGFAAQPTDAPVLPLDELKPGQVGEVWTVFKGTEPEPLKFDPWKLFQFGAIGR